MKILISGGYGFIGSYMVDAFLRKGVQVGIIARHTPQYLDYLTKQLSLYRADIIEEIAVELKEPYDFFIHLAAANDIDSKQAKTALDMTTLGTRNCLDFCYKNQIQNFIYFSTFQVYGADAGFVDETTPVNCKNNYAITHFFAEEYVRMYHKKYGLDYLIVRPTNIYGCFLDKRIDRWSLVPNCFCLEAFENQTITLQSSGKQLRDFISLEDVSNITFFLCGDFEAQKNKVINIASGQSISIIKVAEMVKLAYERLFKKNCQIIIKSKEPLTSVGFSVSVDRAKALGYRYSTNHSFECIIEGIFNMLKQG